MTSSLRRAAPRILLANGEAAEIRVRRSPRAKRLILRIAPFGEGVELVLPRRAGLEEGMEFVRSKLDWIEARLAAEPRRIPFADGVALPFLGADVRIRRTPGSAGAARRVGGELHVGGEAEYLPRRVRDWLRSEARREISRRAHEMAGRLGRKVRRVTLRDPRTRWGSCSVEGGLSFSWRLVLAPPPVLDYVVAHEVAHLAEHNHGPAFWALVESLAGDPSERRKWLRLHGRELRRYG